jgi:dihydrofolate reductase
LARSAGADEEWAGWWGPEPPYHAPVFVLTHYGRDPIQMGGGTTFHFAIEGFGAAYSAACQAAGDNGVDIAGGASIVRQALIAGVIDELTLDIALVMPGSGERIIDGVESFGPPSHQASIPTRGAPVSARPRSTGAPRSETGSRP